jgi:Secretion system C-terminal sorting domain
MKQKFIVCTLFLAALLSCYRIHAQCDFVVSSQVNLALPPATCSYAPTVNDVLVFQNCPGANFVFEALLGGVWVTNPTFTYALVNQTVTFRVRDLVTGLFAQGVVLVQDKSVPVVTCPPNITVVCEESCTIPGLPTIVDCDQSPIITNTQVVTDQPCSSSNVKTIVQTFTATDDGLNSASCTRTVAIRRRVLSSVVFPPHITLNVSGTDCSPWCDNVSNNPNPSPTQNAATFATGAPAINGKAIAATKNPSSSCSVPCLPDCDLSATYSDNVVTLCGTNRRIDRTWTVNSLCGGSSTFVQRISIFTDGNINCGDLCRRPTSLTHSFPNSTQVTLAWTAATSCVQNYALSYRFRIGLIWQLWTFTTVTGTSRTLTIPAGATACQYYLRTNCFGTTSTNTTTYNLATPALHNLDDRSDVADVPTVDEIPETKVFPNPSQGWVTVDLGETLETATDLNLFDAQGRLVQTLVLPATTQRVEVDLSQLPPGIYVLRSRLNSRILCEKVSLN